MNKELIFLIVSLSILGLSIICTFTAPIINNINDDFSRWGKINCKFYSDKESNSNDLDEIQRMKKLKHLCNRQKAMYNLEYISLILNIILSFITSQLSLLLYFKIGGSIDKISGIFGIITAIICFILTFVYICCSGYIFNNDTAYKVLITNTNNYYYVGYCQNKLFSNGALYKWIDDSVSSSHKITVYDNDKSDDAQYAKYKDLGKKQYNYDKKLYEIYSKSTSCFSTGTSRPTKPGGNCDYSYETPKTDSKNKYLFDNWVVTIIFCCFIIAGQIGLGIFGFMTYKGKSDDGQLISNDDNDKENKENKEKDNRLKNNKMLLNLKK
jgi:uncharacterized membrane protein (DUF485 family)